MMSPNPVPKTRAKAALLVAVVVSCIAVVTSSCGLQSASGAVLTAAPGSIKHHDSLDGVKITVGAKDFTEQLVLGNMLTTILSTAGASITNHTNTPGSNGVRNGLLSGDIDISPDYTGTGWINYLGHSNPVKGSKAQYEAIYKEDKDKNQLIWLPPSPENNTYAFAIRESEAKKLDVSKLSDLKGLDKKDLTLCAESEFVSRNDGLYPMLKAYGLGKSDIGKLTKLDTGAIYTATAEGKICNFGEVFTTDGRIPGLHLKVLEDDKGFFPKYNLTEVIRESLLKKHPEIKDIFAKVNPKITNDVMLKLNARVDVKGDDAAIVARDWLIKEGFVN